MRHYTITIQRTAYFHYETEASSREDAEQMAWEAYDPLECEDAENEIISIEEQ